MAVIIPHSLALVLSRWNILYRGRVRSVFIGFSFLLATTILWGSSFPFIKLVVTDIGGAGYVWFRSLIALTGLSPYILYLAVKRRSLDSRVVRGGLTTGLVYAVGLWLQGWGTGLTTASNSAFITGLNVVFIHLYVALFRRDYSSSLMISLVLSVLGLYLLTQPIGGFRIGDLLVLLGAVAWATQVILIDKYSFGDPLVFVFFEMMPSLLYILLNNPVHTLEKLLASNTLYYTVYLGLFCSDVAFTLQVLGQRYVKPAVAGIVFLLEPVFASIFAYIILGEPMSFIQVLGSALILLALLNSTLYVLSDKRR